MTIVSNLHRGSVWLAATCLFYLLLTGVACNDETGTCPYDNRPPAAPRGLYSVTGNEQVYLYWYANTETDLDGYDVWVSDDDENFERLGTVDAHGDDYELEYIDQGARNGTTYFYAVSAFDTHNNESELTRETVFDTPRPEGESWIASEQYDYAIAGFDLSRAQRIGSDNENADLIFYLGAAENEYLISAGTEVWIQDMGYTTDFIDIGWGPYWTMDYGWSPTGIVEAIPGHTYVLLTANDHYAKIRLVPYQEDGELSVQRMDFQWAYQQAALNQELVEP